MLYPVNVCSRSSFICRDHVNCQDFLFFPGVSGTHGHLGRWFLNTLNQVRDQPLLGTMPTPSRNVTSLPASIPGCFSCKPFGQKISMSTVLYEPNPKCRRE